MSNEKVTAAKSKVQRLLDEGFIRKVQYPSWLVNIVMVNKKNIKGRMCTDFTDPKKCCSKDDFPLSRIDKVVDSAVGHEIMVLFDCFSGYHQIWLRKKDEEKQASSCLSAPIVNSGCPKVSRMSAPCSVG
jgi:hypothetical protein